MSAQNIHTTQPLNPGAPVVPPKRDPKTTCYSCRLCCRSGPEDHRTCSERCDDCCAVYCADCCIGWIECCFHCCFCCCYPLCFRFVKTTAERQINNIKRDLGYAQHLGNKLGRTEQKAAENASGTSYSAPVNNV
jgi:hypothetical protein